MCKVCGTNLSIYIDNGSPLCVDCGYFLFVDQYTDKDLELINKKIEEWCEENEYRFDEFDEYHSSSDDD